MSGRVVRARRTSGFSLLDVMLALSVLAVAILGIVSLLLALQARNESFHSGRQAMRACQEVLEVALADSQTRPLDEWARFWNRQVFRPRKLLVLERGVRDVRPVAEGDRETYEGGRVSVRDVSPAEQPGTLWEIAVSIDTTGLTVAPIKASLVTQRSSK